MEGLSSSARLRSRVRAQAQRRLRVLLRRTSTSIQLARRRSEREFCRLEKRRQSSLRSSRAVDEGGQNGASAAVETVERDETDQALYRCDDIVRHLWQNIDLTNSEDALEYFHDDVVYEDLIYEKPFVGKEEVRTFLQSSRENAPEGLRFVLDDVSDGEDACGFTWHLELEINGKSQNITKGISFYRVDTEDRRIIYVTDAPESFIKLGSIGLKLANLAFNFAKKVSLPEDVVKEGFEKVGFVGGSGTRVNWGVLQEKIAEDEVLPDEIERISRREEAAKSLVNIDQLERNRRLIAGSAGMAVTTVLAFLLAGQPWYVRYFGVSPFLGLSLGFLVSGQQGL